MKTTLRGIALLFALLLCAAAAQAQSAAYDRPTVNFLLLKHGDSYDASSAQAFAKIPGEQKFYHNNLPTKELMLRQLSRNDKSSTAWQLVLAELTRQNVARSEIKEWYVRQANGLMSMSLIHSRGEFSATDDAYNLAVSTKRGTEELRDFGSKLIAKTFVVVLDYSSIAYSAKPETDMHSWNSTVRAFVFKLKYNDELEGQIYDAWIDEGDSAQVVADKIRRFDQIPFALEYVTQVSANAGASALMTGKTVANENGLSSMMRMAMRVASREELLNQLYAKGYASAMQALEKQVAQFKVLAGVSGLSPIRSKIGKKEGLKTDQRYFVNEYVADASGQIQPKRKAVVRVGKGVVDNRKVTTGKSEESRFYQVAGGKVEEGMTLEQKNDAGMSLMLGYGPGLQSKEGAPSQSGAKLRVEWLVNRIANLGIWPGLYLYGEGEAELTRYETTIADPGSYLFWRAGFGLGKGFYFWRNFSLSPYLGMGFEFASVQDYSLEDYSLETMYFKAGINAAINIYYPLQLVGGLSAFAYGAPSVRNNYDSDSELPFTKYSDIFPNRTSSGIAGFIGVRINF